MEYKLRNPSEKLLIAMPTRNRPDTAIQSLHSVVKISKRDDIRVLVSDNSDSPSSALREYCEGNGFDYVAQTKVLTMIEHWKWVLTSHEYGWITIMTDRMYFFQEPFLDALKLAKDSGSIVSYDAATFSRVKRLGIEFGVLSTRLKTGKRYKIDTGKLTEMMSFCLSAPALPKLLNCIAPKEIVNEIGKRFTMTLNSIAPDYEFAYKYLMTSSDSYFYHIDDTIFTTHSKSLSNGGGMDSGVSNQASEDFLRLNKLRELEYSPQPNSLNSYSVIAHEFNKVRHEMNLDQQIDEMILSDQIIRWVNSRPKGLGRRINTLRALLKIDSTQVLVVGKNLQLDSIDPRKIRTNENAPTLYD